MKTSKIVVIIAIATMFLACVRNKNGNPALNQTQNQSAFNMIKVTEVIQGGSYTYISATENGIAKWIAVAKQEVNPGEVLYYYDALPMENFHSKEIDKTFDVIYFVNKITKTPGAEQPAMSGGMPSSHQGKVETSDAEVEISKADEELKIADVFGNKADYSSKEFEIRGAVVKVNEQVMGRNWVHIQDGTGTGGNFDLTITTQADVKVGDIVTFKGKLTLEKDFGAGYFYDVIMEDGTLVQKEGTQI